MRRHPRQLSLRFHPRGGARAGAGRKAAYGVAGVSHHGRPRFARLLPVHVTVRMARHVYNLRSVRAFSVVARALAVAADRFGVTITQFSVQGNHMHLVVEAPDTAALSRAMQGLSIRVAKGLNKMMHKRGRVLADRFHAHVLRTPTEARHAALYVRNNRRKHLTELGVTLASSYVDPLDAQTVALPRPRTWLLRAGASPPA